MPHILAAEGLSKSFGKLMAVCDLDIEVRRGEILGVLGPNGAGKTTLFNLLSGDLKPDKGQILFDGEVVTELPPHKRCRMGIARTYQIPRPFQDMSVLENLLVGAVFGAGVHGRKAVVQCENILEMTGLAPKRHVLAGGLPLLDRKRLEMAKALATSPKLLLVDEVAGGLAEPEVEEVLTIMEAVREQGITVLWVEHIMMAMSKGPDRLFAMNFGQNLLEGAPEEVLNSAVVQEIYLGAEED